MAGNSKNILVGAARAFVSYGTGSDRPDLTASTTFPWNVNVATNSGVVSASGTSTPAFLLSTASTFWRDLGFTTNGVELSYEPGYSDVTVDQLLDAARLFQHSLKINLKTEVTEAVFENMNIIFGQAEKTLGVGPTSAASVSTLSVTGTATQPGSVTQMNLLGGALGVSPQERSLVLIGNAPGSWGLTANYPVNTGGSVSTASAWSDTSALRSKERVYVARRAVQEQTTAHALKRDAVTVFPVTFRCLPDADRTTTGGSEYGFIIDRIYGTS